jgi:phosphoserine phosphatase
MTACADQPEVAAVPRGMSLLCYNRRTRRMGKGEQMTTIKLIRHGDTDWNVEQIFRGRADVELNETGIKQAELLGKYLEFVPIEAVYSSPLKRALKTAEIIASFHNIDIAPCRELIDFDYGEWQGLSQDTVKERYETVST